MKSRPSQPKLRQRNHLATGRGFAAVMVAVTIMGSTGCVQDAAISSPERTSALLLELLMDQEAEIRRTAAESLGKIGNPAWAAALSPLLTDPSPLVREAAVKAVGRVHPASTPQIVSLCVAALEDSNESVRRAGAIALGDLEPSAELVSKLPGLLTSPNVGVRKAAAQALLQIDAKSWTPQLAAALHDADPEVRQSVVAALGEWGGPAVGPSIMERLRRDSSPAVRVEAVYRLGKIGGIEMKQELESVQKQEADREVGRWARRAIEDLRSSS